MVPQYLYIDLFCGFGGTSTGLHDAVIDGQPIAKVIACVNHDPKAIKSHWLNYPDVKHFEEDIRTLDLTELKASVKMWKAIYPAALVVLWASLECTNFSKAKGGQARDADSRTLADHLERYITALDPDYVQIENVVEFMSWGPLDENGKPVSRKNGSDWMRWRNEINAMGYRDEWKELNSANFGAYTSRNRLFGCFAKPWLDIVWPEPTHAKTPSKSGMYGDLKKWMPVKHVLDFTDEGESIFTRKKPLSDKTLERIYAGLIKYVAKGDKAFISKYYSGRPAGKVNGINEPAGTVTTVGNQSLIQTSFLVKPEFLASYYGNGHNLTSIESPAPTIPTKDRVALVTPKYFIDKQYSGDRNHQSIDQPAGSILSNDKHALVEATPFIMPTGYDNMPRSIENPAPTLTASRRHHYIVNPSHGGHTTSTELPCPVIVARQDKAPLSVVQCEGGEISIPVYEHDTEISIKIKQFMVIYSLVDIKMRMLRVNELLKIQGFPEGYKMVGNQSDHKKFIGNSVVPHVVKCWVEAMGLQMMNKRKVA